MLEGNEKKEVIDIIKAMSLMMTIKDHVWTFNITKQSDHGEDDKEDDEANHH